MTDYYVAPTGSDGAAGTIGSPFATLQKGHDVAVAGDTVFMRGGVYTVTSRQTFTRDGSSGNRINVFNYPGEVPILDGSGSGVATGDWLVRFNNANWWHLKGLEIRNHHNGGGLTITDTSNNNIVEMCNVHHNGNLSTYPGDGISIHGTASNNLILNCDSHHNKDSDNGDADGFQSTSTGAGNVFRYNRAWKNSDDGYDYWNSEAVTLDGNWAFENGYDDAFNPLGNGTGIKLGGSGAGDGGHTVTKNVSWRNLNHGYTHNSADLPCILYNNTAYDNGGTAFAFNVAIAHILRNNLSYLGSASVHASTDDTFNSWNLGVTVSSADFVSLDFSGATGPRQADGSLPNLNFLKLAAGSDLIDVGTNVGLPFNGAAPDLGAYEFTAVGAAPFVLKKRQVHAVVEASLVYPYEYIQVRRDWASPADQQLPPVDSKVGGLGKRRMIFYHLP